MTKYEGFWDKDKRQGEGLAVFKDGSIYQGSFKKDMFEGPGKFEWATGHIYEGSWRESQMDGQGEFVHSSGRRHIGLFKRNYFLMEFELSAGHSYEKGKCFVNPIEDEKKQKKTIKIYEAEVLGKKDKAGV